MTPVQPSLLDALAARDNALARVEAAAPGDLRFDGSDYLPWRDDERLTGQMKRIAKVMSDCCWHTPSELERETGDNWASISAQLRHLRKERFGTHTIDKESLGFGLYQFRHPSDCPACQAPAQ